MRIQRTRIDGYGRFTGCTLEFDPRIQVVMGPNEKGKSTLRCFIGDVLFGQKRPGANQGYDENRELRTPWDDPERYGGAIDYVLEDGRAFTAARCFDHLRESVRVTAHPDGRDITGAFDTLRNGEPDFAGAHLGLTKAVFLSTATISHTSLEELGDAEALRQIRQRLLELADSGGEGRSSQAALAQLRARIDALGRPGDRGKPLPAAKARMAMLEEELRASRTRREEIARLAAERKQLQDEMSALRARQHGVAGALRALEAHRRAARLEEAEQLQARIDTITQHCFALGAARNFPADKNAEVQRLENRARTARMQLERTRQERASAAAQLESEAGQLGSESATPYEEAPEDLESRLSELTAALQALVERIEETERLVAAAEERFARTQHALDEMPDFTRAASDPVEWVSQLANSFRLAVRSREEECAERDRLREEIRKRREAVAPRQQLFRNMPDFPEQAREYEVQKRMHEEQTLQRRNYLHTLQATRQELNENVPQFIWMGLLCLAGLVGTLAAYAVWEKPAIFIASTVIAVAGIFFFASMLFSRTRLRNLERGIAETEAELEALIQMNQAEPGPIPQLMERANCQTVRELEALYEEFRSASADLAARLEVLEEQEIRAAETEERVPQLTARLREMFRRVGEDIQGEEDVEAAAGRAITCYQEYRETKRRLADSRNVLERHQAELEKLTAQRERVAEQHREAEEALREFLRGRGYEPGPGVSALSALRDYRNRTVRHRERRGRIELLQEKAQTLEGQHAAEEAALAEDENRLAAILKSAGVDSLEAWHALAEQAEEYRRVWDKRTALKEQLETLLQGESAEALRAAVNQDAPLPEQPGEDAPALEAETQRITAQIEACSQREHALHIDITARAAAIRPPAELEEDLAAVRRRVAALELERDAAGRAMALIEQVTHERHSEAAPRLAGLAREYLEEITAGAYGQLEITDDLRVRLTVPQTGRVEEAPEKVLSTGTVDQVYLALRLALIRAFSERGEPVPMLLDDPFANYDDERLERTLHLLMRIGEANQIILFTCREDVARAAELAGAPVLRL